VFSLPLKVHIRNGKIKVSAPAEDLVSIKRRKVAKRHSSEQILIVGGGIPEIEKLK
jgi:hypothetical protein